MSDQVLAAIITGTAAIIAALIGVRQRWKRRNGHPLITNHDQPPIFAAARQFAKYTTLAEQKNLIQPIEVAISRGSLTLSRTQIEQCAASDWELDRIGLYVFEEYTAQSDYAARLLHVQHEYERLRAAAMPHSLLPLQYALRSLLSMARQHSFVARALADQTDLLHELATFLRRHSHLDPRGETQRFVHKLLAVLQRDAA